MSDRHRDRALLHLSKVDAFRDYLVAHGFLDEEKSASPYEILRMRGPRGQVIVYRKASASEHATVYGIGEELARSFIRDTREHR
jgi:hypothetical protein